MEIFKTSVDEQIVEVELDLQSRALFLSTIRETPQR
ncbi:hypothetical protein NC651_038806 [Populus alba x Populus x berolinensis]|nr:hypothetical protein NC651_038806 [Populus alba x Populus x berolinensis]